MKILHIAAIGHHAEGIGSVLTKLVPRQQLLGHDIKILSVYQNKIYKDLNIIYAPNKKVLFAALKDWHPDIVVFHSAYERQYCTFSKLVMECGIPYFVQMHGALSEYNYKKKHWMKWILRKLWIDDFLNKSAALIFLNEEERNNCVAWSSAKRYMIIPNGCDRRNVDKLIEVKTEKEPLTLVFLGRIDFMHKGIDILLQALKILNKQGNTNLKFLFYGNGKDNEIKKLKAELKKLGEWVSYNGPVYGDEKYNVLRKSDIFVLTSRYEGMPMGVLEALSVGTPCLVTPGSNMKNVIVQSNAGWACDLSPKVIASCINQACDEYNENKLYFRQNALNLSYKYDWDLIALQSVTLFSEILKV